MNSKSNLQQCKCYKVHLLRLGKAADKLLSLKIFVQQRVALFFKVVLKSFPNFCLNDQNCFHFIVFSPISFSIKTPKQNILGAISDGLFVNFLCLCLLYRKFSLVGTHHLMQCFSQEQWETQRILYLLTPQIMGYLPIR